jgi:hypothetical protein
MNKYQTFFNACATALDLVDSPPFSFTACCKIAEQIGIKNDSLQSIPELYDLCYRALGEYIHVEKTIQHSFHIDSMYVVFYKIVTFLCINDQQIPVERKGELCTSGERRYDGKGYIERQINTYNMVAQIAATWETGDCFCDCQTAEQVHNYIYMYLNNEGQRDESFFVMLCKIAVQQQEVAITTDNLRIMATHVLMDYMDYIIAQTAKNWEISSFLNYIKRNQRRWTEPMKDTNVLHNDSLKNHIIKSYNVAIKGK